MFPLNTPPGVAKISCDLFANGLRMVRDSDINSVMSLSVQNIALFVLALVSTSASFCLKIRLFWGKNHFVNIKEFVRYAGLNIPFWLRFCFHFKEFWLMFYWTRFWFIPKRFLSTSKLHFFFDNEPFYWIQSRNFWKSRSQKRKPKDEQTNKETDSHE